MTNARYISETIIATDEKPSGFPDDLGNRHYKALVASGDPITPWSETDLEIWEREIGRMDRTVISRSEEDLYDAMLLFAAAVSPPVTLDIADETVARVAVKKAKRAERPT